MIRFVPLAAFALLAATAPAAADGCADAYKKKDWKPALAACSAAAKSGDAMARYRLGQMYRKGRGVKKDAAMAEDWYRKAADAGHPGAQYRVGQALRKGKGAKKDPAAAAGWYRKAAEQGHRQAQMKLGDLYRRGEGVPKDLVRAHMWVSLATAEKRSDAVTAWLAGLEKEMPASDVAKAKAMAADTAKAITAKKK
jgi:TPR repeat protein